MKQKSKLRETVQKLVKEGSTKNEILKLRTHLSSAIDSVQSLQIDIGGSDSQKGRDLEEIYDMLMEALRISTSFR